MSKKNGGNGSSEKRADAQSLEIKVGLAEMLKGGVIMDVTTPEQAKIAEDSGAAAVMALERVPADIRKEGGVARMCAIDIMEGIQKTVSIPVMAKARIGHFMEARVLEALGVDFIDESEVLTPADEAHHIDKRDFRSPFVCGARNLGEALRRIDEGAAMIRTKGEAGSGDIVEAVRHLRQITGDMRALTVAASEELPARAKELRAPRGALHVPGRGSCVRGIRHFQERRSGEPRARHRPRHHALAGSGPGPRSLPRAQGAHARSGCRQHAGRRAPGDAWLVTSDP
jgi:pyridoxal biosynthesis lyase PdxS